MEGTAPMSRSLPRWTVVGFAAAMVAAWTAFAQDKDQAKKKAGGADRGSVTAASPDNQRVAGVIVKAEPIRKGAASRSDDVDRDKGRAFTRRLTINPAAVWRDWVRDQAGLDPNAPPREAAKRGANSVATKGEPESADSLVVIDIGPNTKIETRFRESTDETGKGAKTPAEARAASEDPAAAKTGGNASKGQDKQSDTARITRYQADDLQSGLFVEADYRHEDARNVATTVTVIRPVGGSDTPDKPVGDEGKTKEKSKAKSKKKEG